MSNSYITTIGLEVHAELHTNSKMWCGCKNDPSEKKPNQNICEVCMAHPGTLPVPNKDAIKKVITVGLSVGANIADFTEFDRKNYFYPDIPKGYQLSQYKLPIVCGGKINGVDLTRIHLEEDTAKSSHLPAMLAHAGQAGENGMTLVDYNRAGVPLMELVTEPVIHSAEQAVAFARELQRILRYVGASGANMDMGQMRIEANISVSETNGEFGLNQDGVLVDQTGSGRKPVLGTKCEVKNINSFASVFDAINYEVARHIELIESGGAVVQETRGWDEGKQSTFSQRKKENAHDYRYFPDPDLPKLYLTKLFDIEAMKKEIPLLPKQVRDNLDAIGITGEKQDILIDNIELLKYFNILQPSFSKIEESIKFAQLSSNYLISDVLGLLKKQNKEITYNNLPLATSFSELIAMNLNGELSSRGVKDILLYIMELPNKDGNPHKIKEIAEEKGLIQKNDPELLKNIVTEVITENPLQVADYKSGKESMFMFFVGQCMKKSKGAGNPGIFQELLKVALK